MSGRPPASATAQSSGSAGGSQGQKYIGLQENELDSQKYAGELRTVETAIKTSKEMRTEATKLLDEILPRAKQEMKKMMDELEEARKELIASNKLLLKAMKALPTGADRQSLYTWASS